MKKLKMETPNITDKNIEKNSKTISERTAHSKFV